MKNITPYLLLFLAGLGLNSAFGQSYTPLYAGEYYSDEIDVVDTTGLTFTIVSTMTATSDFGAVDGIFGLALDPTDDQMYVCYESGSAGARRLGTLDTETGAITDIANCGNIIDMDFGPDGTLYGSTGNNAADYSFVEINKSTGVLTLILDYTPSSYGGGMAYDQFNDRMYYQNNNGSAFIDLGTLVETTGTPAGSPGETQAMVILSPTLGWMASYGILYTFNPTTETFSSSIGIDSYHSFAFGQPGCTALEITESATEECEGVEFTLSGVGPGSLTWDGGISDGVAFTPGAPDDYTYTVTSDDASVCAEGTSITITVVGLPTVIGGAGDLIFCEDESITLSSSGDADTYEWNDGEPLDLMPGIGFHTFTLTGAYTEGGCLGEAEDEITVEVVALPTITASIDMETICIGNEITVTGDGGVSYMWSSGIEDGVAFSPNVVGTYTYTVTGVDENGCSNTGTVGAEVVELVAVEGTTTDVIAGDDGEIDITVTGGAPAYTFDWDNDGTGDFDDTEDLTGLADGIYTVVIMSEAGCETTGTYVVGSQLNVDELSSESVTVYPNPTTDFVTLTLSGNFQYELMSISGEILVSASATDQEQISLIDFADGIYFINIKTETGSTAVKVIKK